MTLHDWIEIIKGIPLLIASFVGLYGLRSWIRETRWKKKYELAEEVLSSVYAVEDTIRAIRSPFSHNGEGKTRKRPENEPIEDRNLLDQAYVVFERYEHHKDVFNRLNTIRYRFLAIYGRQHSGLFDRINKLLNEIFIASHMLGTVYWPNQGRKHWGSESEFKKHLDAMHKHQEIFWHQSDNDKVDIKMREIINDFEKVCGKIIQGVK